MSLAGTKVISAVIRGGEAVYREVLKAGLREEWLESDQLRRLWQYIQKYYNRYREVPSEEHLARVDGGFRVVDVSGAVEPYVLELQDIYLGRQLVERAKEIFSSAMRDPQQTLEKLAQMVKELQQVAKPAAAVDLLEGGVEFAREIYEEGKEKKIVKFPWGSVQLETGGLSTGQFVVLFGRPKSMKTFLALWIAVRNFVDEHLRVLVISREMSVAEISRRMLAMVGELDYSRWRRREFDEDELEAIYNRIEKIYEELRKVPSKRSKELPPALKVVDRATLAGKGLDYVRTLIEDFKPDLVIDDSIYLAEHDVGGQGSLDWKAQYYVARVAKSIAQEFDVVYLATTQARRGAAGGGGGGRKSSFQDPLADLHSLDSVAFTDAYAQNCDMLIRVMNRGSYLLLGFPAYREGKLEEIAILARPCIAFDELSFYDIHRYEQDAQVADALVQKRLGEGGLDKGYQSSYSVQHLQKKTK